MATEIYVTDFVRSIGFPAVPAAWPVEKINSWLYKRPATTAFWSGHASLHVHAWTELAVAYVRLKAPGAIAWNMYNAVESVIASVQCRRIAVHPETGVVEINQELRGAAPLDFVIPPALLVPNVIPLPVKLLILTRELVASADRYTQKRHR